MRVQLTYLSNYESLGVLSTDPEIKQSKAKQIISYILTRGTISWFLGLAWHITISNLHIAHASRGCLYVYQKPFARCPDILRLCMRTNKYCTYGCEGHSLLVGSYRTFTVRESRWESWWECSVMVQYIVGYRTVYVGSWILNLVHTKDPCTHVRNMTMLVCSNQSPTAYDS